MHMVFPAIHGKIVVGLKLWFKMTFVAYIHSIHSIFLEIMFVIIYQVLIPGTYQSDHFNMYSINLSKPLT